MTARESPAVTGQKPKIFYGYIIVAAAFLIMTTIWSAFNAFGVFFKPVMTEFGWTRAMTSGGFSLSMIISGVLGVPAGQITDRLGTRLIMTVSGILLGAGYMLMSLTSSSWHFYLIYGLVIGIGMGGCFIPLTSTVSRWFTARRGIMTGIVLVGSGLGPLIGPQVANWLISTYDWRTAYLVIGGVVIVVITLVSQFLRRDPFEMGQVPYGQNMDNPKVAITPQGFSPYEALKTRQFWLFFMALLVFGYYTIIYIVHIVPYADDLGFSAETAATVLSVFGVGAVIGRLFLGSATDRFGNKRISIMCYILSTVVMLSLVLFHQLWALYLLLLLGGLLQGGVIVAWSPLTAELFGMRSHGVILSLLGLGYTAGTAAGSVLTGYMHDATNSYQSAFLIGGILAFVGFILTATLKPVISKQNAQPLTEHRQK